MGGDPSFSSTTAPRDEVPALQAVVYSGFLALDAADDIFIASPNVRQIMPERIIHQYAGREAGSDLLSS